MLKLKLQYFGYLMRRTGSLENTLMLGKIEGGRRKGWQRMRWLDGISDSMDIEFEQALGLGDGQGGLICCSPQGHKESDTTEQLNWIKSATCKTRSPSCIPYRGPEAVSLSPAIPFLKDCFLYHLWFPLCGWFQNDKYKSTFLPATWMVWSVCIHPLKAAHLCCFTVRLQLMCFWGCDLSLP